MSIDKAGVAREDRNRPMMMKPSFHANPTRVLACGLILAALATGVWRIASEPDPDKPVVSPLGRTAAASGSVSLRSDAAGHAPRAAGLRLDEEAERRLREQAASGDLQALQAELAARSEAGTLEGISGVLRELAREGAMEPAQWSLVFSEESDPGLHLKLCAEALSNPSDVIRALASSRLEEASGQIFKDTFQANKWLAERVRK